MKKIIQTNHTANADHHFKVLLPNYISFNFSTSPPKNENYKSEMNRK